MANEDGSLEFADGVLLCLEVICMHDNPVMAGEIVGDIISKDALEAAAKRTGSDCDKRTIQWLNDNNIS